MRNFIAFVRKHRLLRATVCRSNTLSSNPLEHIAIKRNFSRDRHFLEHPLSPGLLQSGRQCHTPHLLLARALHMSSPLLEFPSFRISSARHSRDSSDIMIALGIESLHKFGCVSAIISF